VLKRVMMIAGETSGDLHGAGVVRELRRLVPDVEVYGIGGDRMRQAGMECLIHVSRLSFMGFVEVIRNLRVVREVQREMEKLLETRRPDVLVLIDYPGFNLRFAAKAKARGIRVLYYISPQVWAWHKSRVQGMRGVVDRMKVVFPFEVEIYTAAGINVEFVGHPLAEMIGATLDRDTFFRNHGLQTGKRLLALIPGSRRQEIERIFPVMLQAAARLLGETGVQIAASIAPHIDRALLERLIPHGLPVTLIEGDTYHLMQHADAAVVTSGTATLETGWFGTPMAIVYRTSPLTYAIGRMLVHLDVIGLVNIVAGERLVPEFIQHELNADRLVPELRRMLTDAPYAASIRRRLDIIRTRLGAPGASARVAAGIVELAGAA
jgi:lipid-A-disaccharide synthase